jgi:hypothetical protein
MAVPLLPIKSNTPKFHIDRLQPKVVVTSLLPSAHRLEVTKYRTCPTCPAGHPQILYVQGANNISFAMAPGSLTAVVGPVGCGMPSQGCEWDHGPRLGNKPGHAARGGCRSQQVAACILLSALVRAKERGPFECNPRENLLSATPPSIFSGWGLCSKVFPPPPSKKAFTKCSQESFAWLKQTAVYAGKTTLLMAVLDQLEAASPRIRIGYVPQVPWILSGRLGLFVLAAILRPAVQERIYVAVSTSGC